MRETQHNLEGTTCPESLRLNSFLDSRCSCCVQFSHVLANLKLQHFYTSLFYHLPVCLLAIIFPLSAICIAVEPLHAPCGLPVSHCLSTKLSCKLVNNLLTIAHKKVSLRKLLSVGPCLVPPPTRNSELVRATTGAFNLQEAVAPNSATEKPSGLIGSHANEQR